VDVESSKVREDIMNQLANKSYRICMKSRGLGRESWFTVQAKSLDEAERRGRAAANKHQYFEKAILVERKES
jgi:hypothetical protein